MKVYKFPKIEQFRNVINSVKYNTQIIGKNENNEPIFDETIPLPTLKYRGSVKLNGTNAGIVFKYDEKTNKYTHQVQSRTRIITPIDDNYGFATFVNSLPLKSLLELLPQTNLAGQPYGVTKYPTIRIYGEWCGDNIQKGVALNQLDKMYVIFAVKIDNVWISDEHLKNIKLPDNKVFNILDYKVYNIKIDFNNPKESAEKISKLVDEVENECPVGKAFGKSGIGEGIVWICKEEGWTNSRYWFKTKGEKHSDTKKDKKNKVPVDTAKINKINELVEFLVTEHRLLKGIDYLKENNYEITRKSTGLYLKWIYNDVVKEEIDTIIDNGFKPKEISKKISNYARTWFFKYIDELIGL